MSLAILATRGWSSLTHRQLILGAAAGLLFLALTPPIPADAADPAIVGAWHPVVPWPIKATHTVLLPTGKVLAWEETGGGSDAEVRVYLWDPATGVMEAAPLVTNDNIFCAGHSILPDGRVLVAGGAPFWAGPPVSYLFDPWTETWSQGPDMVVGRYYPTPVPLADGRVLIAGGTYGTGQSSEPVEVFTPGTPDLWDEIEGADRALGEYPWLTLGPDGRVVKAGPREESLFLDVDAATWSPGPTPIISEREGGSFVPLPGGDKILVAGGQRWGFPSTNTAEILDLSAEPTWKPAASMQQGRRDLLLTLLMDGTVFAMGGSLGQTGTLLSVPGVLTPELYDPSADTWRSLAPNQRTRAYHSTSLVLPDGRVLVAGGEMEGFPNVFAGESMEIYHPPYLFAGPRPVVTQAPPAISYGAPFTVEVGANVAVERLALLRLGSVTHSINFDQQYVELPFQQIDETTLTVEAPADALEARPGWHLLIGLSGAGVPGVAPIVAVGP